MQFSAYMKSFTATAAPVLVVVSVDGDDVPIQVRRIREPGRADRAGIRPLPCVGPCVLGETPSCREPGPAQLALVRLHAIVRLHMCGVTTQLGKRGAALLTLTDLLPSVDTSVWNQGRE